MAHTHIACSARSEVTQSLDRWFREAGKKSGVRRLTCLIALPEARGERHRRERTGAELAPLDGSRALESVKEPSRGAKYGGCYRVGQTYGVALPAHGNYSVLRAGI